MMSFKHQGYLVRMWGISRPVSVNKQLLYFNGGDIFFRVKAFVYDFIKVPLIMHLVFSTAWTLVHLCAYT